MNRWVEAMFRGAAIEAGSELSEHPQQREARRTFGTEAEQFELIVRRLPPVEALEPESLESIGE